jgi:hypothetical protein
MTINLSTMFTSTGQVAAPERFAGTLLARAPDPQPTRREKDPTRRERDLFTAWCTVGLGQIASNSIGQPLSHTLPRRKDFQGALALLQSHGVVLRGKADKFTHTGKHLRQAGVTAFASNPNMNVETARGEGVASSDLGRLRLAFRMLSAAGFRLDQVTSPRVQALMAADTAFARWREEYVSPRGRHGDDVKLINDRVSAAKVNFVRALEEVDGTSNPSRELLGRLADADGALRTLTDQLLGHGQPYGATPE